MSALLQSSALWYASRATGFVSLLLLTGVVLLGLLVTTSGRLPGLPRFATTALHRNLSLLSLVFLAVHVASVVIDPYVTINWTQVVVPFGGSYRPFWVGLGTVALDLLLALIVTSLLRVRIGLGTWRAIHWLAYAMWPVAVVHGIGAGTDMRSGWMLATALVLVGLVALAVIWRGVHAAGDAPRAERVAVAMAHATAPTPSSAVARTAAPAPTRATDGPLPPSRPAVRSTPGARR